MDFSLSASIDILERTPDVLLSLLQNISDDWTLQNEGPDTWSVYDVLVHLIQGERTDWIPRMEIILSTHYDKRFNPFIRMPEGEHAGEISLKDLLIEFKRLREINLGILRTKNPGSIDLALTGIHPEFGEVTLNQLLATWVVHDLNHLAQIARVMSFQYKTAVGPWIGYLGILKVKK